jgi:anti-sigma B factor antagonist
MLLFLDKTQKVTELEFPDLRLEFEQGQSAGKPVEVCRFIGRITNSNSFELNRKIHGLFDGESRHVILDLSRLEYINSTGVAIIFSIFFRLREKGGQLLIGGTHPFLKRVFSLMDLPQGMVMLDTVEEAKSVIQ